MRAGLILILFSAIVTYAQEKNLPYAEIPAYPESFTAGAVASRMIDGLGFRFYWATEGLRSADLAYKPSTDARTSEETIAHIYEMSFMIRNATTQTVNTSDQAPEVPFDAMRKQTLENLKIASDRLRTCADQELNEFKIIFKRGDTVREFPFWNHLNGPIADCLWHVGQVVSFRRSSGNPISDKVNVFTGTVAK